MSSNLHAIFQHLIGAWNRANSNGFDEVASEIAQTIDRIAAGQVTFAYVVRGGSVNEDSQPSFSAAISAAEDSRDALGAREFFITLA